MLESSRQWKLFSAVDRLSSYFSLSMATLSNNCNNLLHVHRKIKSFTLGRLKSFRARPIIGWECQWEITHVQAEIIPCVRARETTRNFFIITREICVLHSGFLFFRWIWKIRKIHGADISSVGRSRLRSRVADVCGDDDDQRCFFSCVSHRHHDILARNDIYKIT